jgi:hypothetical protein
MNRKLSKTNYWALIRSVAVLTTTVGPNLAWAISAHGAGNVEVTLENGDAVLTGDDGDNNIIVTQECCEKVVVTGRADTTINGTTGRFDVEGVTGDIVIEMHGGADFVRVEVVAGAPGIGKDLKIGMGKGDDIVELLGVTVGDDTRVNMGDGSDIIFIDGVREPNGYRRSDFQGKFVLDAGSGDDLFEFHHAVFRSEVDVSMGTGIDGACNTEDSQFLMKDLTRFDGGPPTGFPGDGFVAPSIHFQHIVNFEEFPDDCSFLGGTD